MGAAPFQRWCTRCSSSITLRIARPRKEHLPSPPFVFGLHSPRFLSGWQLLAPASRARSPEHVRRFAHAVCKYTNINIFIFKTLRFTIFVALFLTSSSFSTRTVHLSATFFLLLCIERNYSPFPNGLLYLADWPGGGLQRGDTIAYAASGTIYSQVPGGSFSSFLACDDKYSHPIVGHLC